MSLKYKCAVFCACAIAFAAPQAALADCSTDSSYTKITGTNFVVEQPGKYCLTQDLTVSVEDYDGLEINTGSLGGQSVLIDLNEHKIALVVESGENVAYTAGVFISSVDDGNVTVQNGTIQGFDWGVFSFSGVGGTLNVQDVDIVIDNPEAAYATGIDVSDFDEVVVTGGSIHAEIPGAYAGMLIWEVPVITVASAEIVSSGHGIITTGADRVSVFDSVLTNDHDHITTWGIGLADTPNSMIVNTDISGFGVGVHYDEASDAKGIYARTTVSALDQCFVGGMAIGSKNTCTIEP